MAVNTTALSFNGINQHAKMTVTGGGTPTGPSIHGMDTFTWMAFIKVGRLSLSSQQRAWTEVQGTANGNTQGGIRFACVPYKGKLRFEFSAKDGRADTNYDYSLDWGARWRHVAFVARLGGSTPTYETYLDGIQVATGTLVLPAGTTAISDTIPMPITGGTSAVYMGNYSLHSNLGTESLGSDKYWHGAIDDVMIFNTAKSAGDIVSYISRRNSWDSADADLFSEWRFNPTIPATTTSIVDSDNPTWTGTIYQAGVASSALWTSNRARSNDRPYLGASTNMATGPTDSTAPAAPTGLTNSTPTSDGTVTITYNRSTDNIYVQSYVLDISTLSNFSTKTSYTANNTAIDEDSPSQDSMTLTNLLPNQTYYVRVSAIDAALNVSTPSTTLSFATPVAADLTPPSVPINLAVTNLTYSTFRVTYAAGSGDTVGYRVDVSSSPTFDSYVSGYQNLDRGSALFVDVTGVEPLKKYYARVRAYDLAGNDSVSSAALTITTPAQPDVTPPNPVLTLAPTSIGARSFTANWEEGVDNVGVVRYYVDVALNSAFSQYATTPFATLSNVNVGNVTSYHFDNLQPSTTYYYRVRAEDAAGNDSENTTDYMPVETAPSSLDDGGVLEVTSYTGGDAYTQSAATTTNAGSATFLQVAGNGAANTKNTYLLVSTQELAGNLQSAMLRLYTTTLGTGAITAMVTAVSFVESTITWSNQPAMTGGTLTFTPLANNAWVEVDLGSLFVAGPAIYTIRLSTTANTTYQFDSKEGTNGPQIVLISDPSTATRIDADMQLIPSTTTISNYLTNPSFEIGTTAGWSAVGSTPATLSISTDGNCHKGANSLIITAGGSVAGQGIENVKTQVPATNGKVFSVNGYIRSISGTTNWRLVARVYNSSSTLLNTYTKTITLATDRYTRYDNTITVTDATAAYITLGIETNTAAAAVARVDGLMIANHGAGWLPPMFFDGDTSGAYWTGTPRASVSRYNTPSFSIVSTYVGDADADNSVRTLFRPSGQVDYIYLNLPTTINRSTKTATTSVAPTYAMYNFIRNPRFQNSLYDWTAFGGATIALENEFTNGNEYALAITFASGSGAGVIAGTVREPANGDILSATAWLYVPVGMQIGLIIREYNSAGSLTNTTTTSITGTGEWIFTNATRTYAQTAGSLRYEVSTISGNTVAGTVYLTQPMFTRVPTTATINPYRDGTMSDTTWAGNPNASFTALFIQEATVYDFQHIYTDPDGVVGGFSATEVSTAESMTTPAELDYAVTITNFAATSAVGTTIDFVGNYSGDDDNNMTALVEYKRYDLGNWTVVNVNYNRVAKLFSGTIAGLNEGTKYSVRATLSDSTAVYGTNPWTIDVTTLAEHSQSDHSTTISFGGFVLQGEGVEDFGVSEHDAFGFPERRLQTQDYIREHGGVELSDFWGKKTINMSGFVSGGSRPELEANLAMLKRALAPSKQPLVIDTLAHEARHYTATCQGLEISETAGENYRHLTWKTQFVCVDPFAYDRDVTSIESLSVVDGSEITVNNVGDLSVFPLVTITTAHTRQTNIVVENTTTSERIVPLATVRSGQTLVIDNERKALYKNGVEVEYAGGFFTLAAGSNTLKFTVESTVSPPTLNVDIQWRAKYL